MSGAKPGKKTRGRVKIKMEFIDNKLRRYTTFSKRKTGIMKKVERAPGGGEREEGGRKQRGCWRLGLPRPPPGPDAHGQGGKIRKRGAPAAPRPGVGCPGL